jgi:hypothetical protein
MNDLIYCENQKDYNEIKAKILVEFPNMKFEDASDFVHLYRFGVQSDDIESEDFLVFAIKQGFGLSTLGLNLMIQMNPDKIKKLITEVQDGKSSRQDS